jgi:anti-sigma regulatory factor (Ser/Thr protein kinase)
LSSGPAKMWVLPSEVTAVIHARRHVVGSCEGMPTEKVDIARLLVTELVSNAVRHGSGTVVLAVAREGGGVRVEVYDESPDMPVLREPESLMEHGAGLRLVAALASSWGVASHDGGLPGKRVWFALV